jgi:hypothetical protein
MQCATGGGSQITHCWLSRDISYLQLNRSSTRSGECIYTRRAPCSFWGPSCEVVEHWSILHSGSSCRADSAGRKAYKHCYSNRLHIDDYAAFNPLILHSSATSSHTRQVVPGFVEALVAPIRSASNGIDNLTSFQDLCFSLPQMSYPENCFLHFSLLP